MPDVDATTLADRVVRLGLVQPQHVQAAWEELGGSRGVASTAFLRCLERQGALTPFQSSRLLKGHTDGFFLGGFRLLYKIASGSFGRVFRADDPSTGRVIAIKVLRAKWTEDRHKIDLFVREGRMGMTLHHPNIVEILAVNHDRVANQYYIAMEFVEGGNLRDFLHIRKSLTPLEVVKILDDTTAGLAYAFAHGVTHRDMKLTNILLSTSQGTAKLVDFGLAGGNVGFDSEDVSAERTVDYAGLEKATGATAGDPRSDIFFLGCVAYELLTGRPPLDRRIRGQARMQPLRFLSIQPLRPHEIQAPPSLFRLIENMMALKPTDRFQTPSQLLENVREVRRELEGTKGIQTGRTQQRTIFLAESDELLQDLLRTKLRERGFKMLIASDPLRALDRFRQQPFDLLIVDAMSTGENGMEVFQTIMNDARRLGIICFGILMISEAQATWRERFGEYPNVKVLMQPIKYKHLVQAIQELLGPLPNKEQAESSPNEPTDH